MERDIETHIEKDKKILEDPTISPQDTLTKMNLVRDTFGRKPKTRG